MFIKQLYEVSAMNSNWTGRISHCPRG